jgi:choline dehydrogenase-like flavoprotein
LFEGKKATGMEVENGGARFVVEAEEILLTAGAIASPQLLMLSGVGPAEPLHSLGIPVVQALPGVGQNLRDHPNIRVPVQVKEGFPLDPKPPDATGPALHRQRIQHPQRHADHAVVLFLADRGEPA